MAKYANYGIILVLCIIYAVSKFVDACEMDQTQYGCKIENGACSCSFGCKSEYRYLSKIECENALKGTSNDICGRQPCSNGGNCIQVSQKPGYKCRCEGTGYWGNRCQRLCPGPHEYHTQFPYECIVI